MAFRAVLIVVAFWLWGCSGSVVTPDGGVNEAAVPPDSTFVGDSGTSDCALAPDGTSCAPGSVCISGECRATRCGDGEVDPSTEQCDDGNTVAFDGCTACQFDCSGDSECDDLDSCNSVEHCGSTHRCETGAPLGDGARCTAEHITDGVCSSAHCITAGCGNSVV